MVRDFNSDIKKLRKGLLDNEISLFDAINEFIELLNDFQNEDEEIILFESNFSNINNELIETNKKTKERIRNLNKIIILQELGIKFNESEISILLAQ